MGQNSGVLLKEVSFNSGFNHSSGNILALEGIRVSGYLILSGEPLAKGYYKWHPERKEKKTYIQEAS